MSVYKGNTSIDTDLKPVVRMQWRRGGGPAYEITMQGSLDRMEYEAGQLVDQFDAIDIVQVQGDWFELRAAQQGDDVSEEHEVDGSNFTQSTLINLLVKQQFLAVSASITDAQYNRIVSTILDEVNKKKAGSQTYVQMQTAINNMLAELSLASVSELALELADDIDRHGDQFMQAQYVYRHSIVVAERVFKANGGSYAGIYNNTHRIFTEDQLRSAELIPLEFALPPKVLDNAQTAEWLKLPSRARIDRLKRTLITEYAFADEWSRKRYAEAVTA
jgi:hypothetical protein